MSGMVAQQWAKRVLIALLVLVALTHLGFRIQLITDHRVDLGGAEINVVYGMQKILLGRPLYEDPEQPPFDVMQYTPLYYGVCAGIGKVLRIDPHDTYALFMLSRIVSLVFNLFTCLLVFRLCRMLGSDAWLSVAVAAVAFALFTEHFYSRVDSLYALLFVGTMAMYVRWMQQGNRSIHLLLTALLAVLCLLTKQTGILVIGIIGTHLLISRQWRSLLVFSSVVVLLAEVGLLLTMSNTTPEIFLKNTAQGIANGMEGTMYRELFDQGTYKYYVGWHIAGIVLIVLFIRTRDALDRFLAMAIGCAYAFGFVTGLKNASNLNYLFEAHLFILIGVARWSCERAARWQVQCTGLFLLYGLLFTVHRTRILHNRVGTEVDSTRTEVAYHADLRMRDVLVNELGLRPEEKVFITYRGHLELLLNGQGLLAQKDVIEWSVEPLFNYDGFHQAMSDGSVRYVISDAPMDTLRFLGHAQPRLQVVRKVEGRFILAPNAR